MRTLDDIAEEYEVLDRDDRWRMLIELGDTLENFVFFGDIIEGAHRARPTRAQLSRKARQAG